MAERTRTTAFLSTSTAVVSARSNKPVGYTQGMPPQDYYGHAAGSLFPPQKKKEVKLIGPGEPVSDPLSHIREAIEASRILLDLEDNWDGEGSEKYDESTWRKATAFLAVQAAYVLSARTKLPSPDIAPGPRGSIDLVWQERDFRLLVNVPRTADGFGYWGKNQLLEVKGIILDPTADHKELFLWLMKKP